MKPIALAQKYMEIFFSGDNLDELYTLFADNLDFRGPLYTFNSAKAYINSLKSDPPENCHFEIIQSFENKTSACLIYKFSKPGVNTLMTQFFEVKDGKICRIILMFDTAAFNK